MEASQVAPESYLTSPPGHLRREKRTALSGPRWQMKKAVALPPAGKVAAPMGLFVRNPSKVDSFVGKLSGKGL